MVSGRHEELPNCPADDHNELAKVSEQKVTGLVDYQVNPVEKTSVLEASGADEAVNRKQDR